MAPVAAKRSTVAKPIGVKSTLEEKIGLDPRALGASLEKAFAAATKDATDRLLKKGIVVSGRLDDGTLGSRDPDGSITHRRAHGRGQRQG